MSSCSSFNYTAEVEGGGYISCDKTSLNQAIENKYAFHKKIVKYAKLAAKKKVNMDTIRHWIIDIWSYLISLACCVAGISDWLTPARCDALDSYLCVLAHILAICVAVPTLIFITMPKSYRQIKRWRDGEK